MSMNELDLMRADAKLDPAITFEGPLATHWAEPKAILLTGATGFLGAFILDELLRSTDADVYCLVRAADDAAARARLHAHLRASGVWREDLATRVIALAGDLTRPALGLDAADHARLAERIDAIYHNGAWINAMLSYEDLRAANVLGTEHMLRFAGSGPTKPLHYVSTLAIFFGAAHAGQPLAETELPVLDASLRGGYKRGKWVAEHLVREAQARGLPAAVYRPGRILGHSRSGFNGNLRDVLCSVLKGCVLLGQYPDVATGIDVTPVDHAARAIVRLARGGGALGRAFHLCNPAPIAWNAFMEGVRELGYPLQRVSYPAWREALAQRAAGEGREPFFRQLRLLLRSPIYLFADDKPQFCAERTHRALAAAKESCPPVDRELLRVYLDYFRRCGFLPPLAPTEQRPRSGASAS